MLLSHEKINKGKLIFFHEDINSCDRKKILSWKKLIRKKIERYFPKRTSYDKKKNLSLFE